MENSNPEQINMTTPQTSQPLNWLVVVLVVCLIGVGIYYFIAIKTPEEVPSSIEPIVQQEPEPVPVIKPVPIEQKTVPEVVEKVPVEEVALAKEEVIEEPVALLPQLNDSDSWLKEKLVELTWRKELLRLVIDEDMVRRLVVFTDNFSQGNIAYDYSPLVKPQNKFSAIEGATESQTKQWYWDEDQTRRFSLYVDLMRSFEPESLAKWYYELKPLIDEAYQELGYPDSDFTETLQNAIVRVLDMEIPKATVVLTRPSVMYKYQDNELESLPDADKLLLRIGKDNLLVIKSFLLEFSDALSREGNKL